MFGRRSIAFGLALVLSSAPLLAFQAPAPDLTGTWIGKFTMTNKEGTKEESAHVVLKQTKTDLSGTAGPSAERQFAINTGRVTTAKGETSVVFDTGREGHLITFELKLIEGRLKGTARDQFYPDNKLMVDLQRK